MVQDTLTNTVYIRTSAEELWQALTDGDLSVQYVGARVQSTWRPGDEIVYLTPDGSARIIEGTLLEVVPRRRFVFEARLLLDPTLAFQGQGSMQMCGSSLKSLLETGEPLQFGPMKVKAEAV